MNPLVLDLSHFDGPGSDYAKLKANGVIGIIYKSTQGIGMGDTTYNAQKARALAAGLKWGSYHFGDASDPIGQAKHYISVTKPDADELFALDFEDNGSSSMNIAGAKEFIAAAEAELKRPGELVFYSGNRVKDLLGHAVDPFLGARRLWLAEYSFKAVLPASWLGYWLWQYTDGRVGPEPHTVPGAAGNIDCNHYSGSAQQLAAEWASGAAVSPQPPPPPAVIATVKVFAPPGVQIQVIEIAKT